MIITSTNITPIKQNRNPIKTQPNIQYTRDSFTFTGNKFGMLKRPTIEALENIETAYNDIMSHLLRKTDEGLENIEKIYENFSYKKGMVFHNCGDEGVSIAVRMPEGKDFSGLMRIMVRKGNTFFKERIVLDSYLIKDCDKLVSDFDKTHLNYFPKDCKLMTPEEIETSGADKKIQDIVNDLDFAMLKFRQYLIKNKNVDIKIPDFKVPYHISDKLDSLKKLNEVITEKLKNLPKKVALYAKNSFGDYELTTGQSTNMMKNLGPDNLKMTISELNNPEHGKLTRLMVFDENDVPAAGYLVNSDGKIVSNFNYEYMAVIPPKLTLLNEEEAKTFMPQFEKHMTLFEEKLKKFDEYINEINKKRAQRLEDIEARKAAKELKKQEKVVTRAETVDTKLVKETKIKREPKQPKELKPKREPKQIPVSRQKEYKELMKDSLAKLKDSMSSIDDNLDDFKKTMAEIQKQVEEYFESHK